MDYSYPGEENHAHWNKLAADNEHYLKKYTPTVWQEIQGFKAGGGDEIYHNVLLANYEFELYMWTMLKKYGDGNPPKSAGRCSAVAGVRTVTNDDGSTRTHLLAAQANDWDLPSYLGGKMENVFHHLPPACDGEDCEPEGLETLIYTEPGYLGFMGMNSAGLIVMWQTIDDGHRADGGVGVTAIIREALTYKTIDDAINFVCSTPLIQPLNLMMAQPPDKFLDVEISPPYGCTRMGSRSSGPGEPDPSAPDRYLLHTNHILYDFTMLDRGDKYRNYTKDLPDNTVTRFNYLHKHIKKAYADGDWSAERIADIYTQFPLYRTSTMANLIFDPNALDDEGHWKNPFRLKYRDEDWKVYTFVNH